MEKHALFQKYFNGNRVIYYGNDAISITYYTEKMKENSFLFYRLRPDLLFYGFLEVEWKKPLSGLRKEPFAKQDTAVQRPGQQAVSQCIRILE